MKYNKPLLAMILPSISLFPGEIFTQIMKYFNLTTLSTADVISMMWMPEGNWYIGIAGALGILFWAGLIIYYSTKIWGTAYLPVKAALIVMTIESFVFIIFGVLGKNLNVIQKASGNFVHLIAAAIIGLLLGLLLKRYVFDPDVS
jgi:hypothetical protein